MMRDGTATDTMVTVKLWAILVVLITILGSMLGILYSGNRDVQFAINAQSNRITRLEVLIPTINENLTMIRDDVKSIRQEQKRENR